jgi:fimbrial chaperone protein
MRFSLFLSAALVLGSLAGQSAQAASKLEISPVRISLPHQRPLVTLHLHNQGDEPTTVQLEGFRWTQVDGADRYERDYNLIVTPPIATLPPGAEQTVRVGLAEPHGSPQEIAYRLNLREVPQANQPDSQTVRVLLQVSLPVFAPPAKVDTAKVEWTLHKQADGFYYLHANNTGALHVQVSRVQLSAADAAISNSRTMRYLLPGSAASWRIEDASGRPIAQLPVALKLSATTDKGQIETAIRSD